MRSESFLVEREHNFETFFLQTQVFFYPSSAIPLIGAEPNLNFYQSWRPQNFSTSSERKTAQQVHCLWGEKLFSHTTRDTERNEKIFLIN